MKRRIFIIHKSEIIRKGLSAILRNYFNIEIIQLSDIDKIKAFSNISNAHLIIFCEDEVSSNFNLIQSLSTNNSVKSIGFSLPSDSSAFKFDFTINLKTSSSDIRDVVEKCLTSNDKTVNEHEGEDLTTREKEVLKLVASGYSNKKIAEQLFISIHTVISHRQNLTEKTGIKSISGLTVYAILNNLIDTDNINPEDLI